MASDKQSSHKDQESSSLNLNKTEKNHGSVLKFKADGYINQRETQKKDTSYGSERRETQKKEMSYGNVLKFTPNVGRANQEEELVREGCDRKRKFLNAHTYKDFIRRQCMRATVSDDMQELGRPKIPPQDQRKLRHTDHVMGKCNEVTDDDSFEPELFNRKKNRSLPSGSSEASDHDALNAPKDGSGGIKADHVSAGGKSRVFDETCVVYSKTERVKKVDHDCRMTETEIANMLRRVRRKCEKRREELVKKHEGETHEFQCSWEKKKAVLEKDYKKELTRICSTYTRPVRSQKLNQLDDEFASQIEECKCLKDICLKNLQDKQSAEMNNHSQKAARCLNEAKSCARKARAQNEMSFSGSKKGNRVDCCDDNEHQIQDNVADFDLLNAVEPHKEKIDPKESLPIAQNENLKQSKDTFLTPLQKIKEPNLLQDRPEATEREPMGSTVSHSDSVKLQNVETGIEEITQDSVTVEKENANMIKQIKSKCEKQMASLIEKHQKEIQEFHRSWKRKRAVLENDHKREAAHICSMSKGSIRSYKLVELDNKSAFRMKEYENEKSKSLKDLADAQLVERSEERQRAARSLASSKMCDENVKGSDDISSLLSTCKSSSVGANGKPNHNNHFVQPPEKPELPLPFGQSPADLPPGQGLVNVPHGISQDSPLRNNMHNMEEQSPDNMILREGSNAMKQSIQREILHVDESMVANRASTARTGEIDLVKDGSIDVSDKTMFSKSLSCDFQTRVSDGVHLNVQAEEMLKERCEVVPELEVSGFVSTEIVAPNVDGPMTSGKIGPAVIQESIMVQAEGIATHIHETALKEAVLGDTESIENGISDVNGFNTERFRKVNVPSSVLANESGGSVSRINSHLSAPLVSVDDIPSPPFPSPPPDSLENVFSPRACSNAPEECDSSCFEIVPSQRPSYSPKISRFNCEDVSLEACHELESSLCATLPVAQYQVDLLPPSRPLHVPLPFSERMENLPLSTADPLQVEYERLLKDNELNIHLHEVTKLRLKCDQDNEILELAAQIKSKYEAKFREAELAYLKEMQDIGAKCRLVGMNRTLAWLSRSTDIDCGLNSSIHLRHETDSPAGQFPGFQQPTMPPSYAFAPPSFSQFPGFQHPPTVQLHMQNVQRPAAPTRSPSVNPSLQPFQPPYSLLSFLNQIRPHRFS